MPSMISISCFLALLSVVNAAVIPFQRIRISSELRGEGNDYAVNRRGLTTSSTPDAETTVSTTITISSTPTSTMSTSTPTTTSTSSPSSSSSSMTTSTSIPSSTSSPAPSQSTDASQKYVVAHHIVGNTFPYTVQDWADDITLAHASGIDAFALNMGSDDWEPDRVADAYQAAQQTNLGFKLFLSLDMTSLPCASANDAQNLRNLVNTHASHPNQLQYDSRTFVSTFSGENCQFGQGSVPEGWKNQFTQHPDLQGKVYFVPSFFMDPSTFKNFADVMDGDFNWNSGWPIEVTTSFAQNVLSNFNNSQSPSDKALLTPLTSNSEENSVAASVSSVLSKMQLALSQFIGTTNSDEQHLTGLAALSGSIQARDGQPKTTYMGAVSPWFFTHYGPDSFNKNFVYLSDQHLYAKRWEAVISNRSQFDLIQVLTWNDYGESDYIGPIKGAQPNSQAWTDGMNHTSWLDLTKYYATAFKTGQYPAIEKDQIVMWSRPHSTSAQAPDPVPQPANFQLFEDLVWAVVLTTAPANVTLSTSSNPTDSKTFQVPAGLSKLAVPISPGGTMKGVIQRGGQTILELSPSNFTFQGSPQTYNFNAFVASAVAN